MVNELLSMDIHIDIDYIDPSSHRGSCHLPGLFHGHQLPKSHRWNLRGGALREETMMDAALCEAILERKHGDPRWSRVDLLRMMLGTTRPGISCQGMVGTWETLRTGFQSPFRNDSVCYSEILALSLPCHARNVTSSTPMPCCHPVPGPALSRAQGLCRACIDPTPSAEGRHHWYLPWEIQWCRCCSGTKLASCLHRTNNFCLSPK